MRDVRGRWLDVVVAIFGACALFAVLGGTISDPDLWGHVRFGQLMRDLGFVPRQDPYTYTGAGRTWINHEWLAEWVFGWVYDVASTWGLVVLKLLFVATVFGLAADHLRRRGVGTVLGTIMLLLVALGTAPSLTTLRPHVFTVLFFLIVLLILRSCRNRPGVLWLLPAVFALWINVHGGVLAGLGIVAIWFAAEAVEVKRARRQVEVKSAGTFLGLRAAVGLSSAAALLLNPYGPGLPRFLLETATVPRPFITEWAPLSLSSTYGAVYLILLAVGVVLLALSRLRPRLPEAVLLAVGALLPFVAFRHLPLFGLIWLVALADPAADVWARIIERRSTTAPVHLEWLRRGAVVALLLGSVGLAWDGARGLGCIASSGPETIEYPREPVGYLKSIDRPFNLAVHFTWGEYVIWHLGPGVQVSMDGRRETVYPDSVYHAYLAFQTGEGDWRDHLEDPPADLALVTRAGPAANLLELSPGWTRHFEGSVGVLYARDDLVPTLPEVNVRPRLQDPQLSPDDRQSCFPE